ncbi:MAG: DUF2779 domain-containing protein [Chloroflexota bacterium]
MKNVSKPVFLNAMVCPSLGWLYRSSEPVEELSPKTLGLAERFRIEQGAEIGRRARSLHAGRTLVDERSLAAAAKRTALLLADGACKAIFEATFLVDGYVSKPDILLRKKKGWHLIEVKSDVNDKPELVDDLAFTVMVMTRAGVDVASASLMLISKDYRLGMTDDLLFVDVDHTSDGLTRAVEFAGYWEDVEKLTSAAKMPEPESRLECKKCPLLLNCVGKGIENHVLEIPRLSQRKFDALRALGVACIEDVPADFELTENQARVRSCVVSKKPWVSENLKGALDAITWPAFYLDFETTMTAIPLYPDMAPYQQMATQYALHKCSDVGKVVTHKEFLSDHRKDDRRRLAESLIRDVETKGSIITYSTFERTTINALAERYPDIGPRLSGLLERIIDLEAIVRQNFYHPEFHGSTSIKRTLPALVPDMSYDGLEIGDGDSASAAFAYLALGRWKTQAEIEAVRQDLLRYCEQDTLAMVKLHERLHSWE